MRGMALSKDLLEILVCPSCRGDLAYRPESATPNLKCVACRRVYPIRDNIPVMLIDESTVEE
jgi:uncharacterized protein YbaR (Trm112 family)